MSIFDRIREARVLVELRGEAAALKIRLVEV